MRWNTDKVQHKQIVLTFFAWFPVTVRGETRWLEKVSIKGYWFLGSGNEDWIFFKEKFID